MVGQFGYGNLYDILWTVSNTSAKYSTDGGSTYTVAPYEKTSESSVLLTTGASYEFSTAGIYDFFGNVGEMVLQRRSSKGYWMDPKGGDFQCYVSEEREERVDGFRKA